MNDHVGYKIPEGVEVIRAPIAQKFLTCGHQKLGEHSGYAYFQNVPAVEVGLPFKLKGERNPKGGWMNIIREKDHSGQLELVYLNEEESKQAERKGLSTSNA